MALRIRLLSSNVLNVRLPNVVNVRERNELLLRPGATPLLALPNLAEVRRRPFVFAVDFGLGALPEEPGFLAVRGARQYGKSTWLEGQIEDTIARFGAGSALYLNGDELRGAAELGEAIRLLLPMFSPSGPVKRLFIDEITAVKDWSRAIKALIDGGDLRDVLVVTTGSRATDLRRGVERLPGRKGRLARTAYLFTPIAYREFRRVAGDRLGEATLVAYLLSGGSPVALGELLAGQRLPEYVVHMVKDWIQGECAASGRDRASLLAVMEQLHRLGGTAAAQAKIAREAGLANNTVAAGYVELLSDLMCVGVARAWDPSARVRLRRKPAKLPFINLLAAVAWSSSGLRSVDDFSRLPRELRGVWWEWLVAQELWRRAARRGDETPEELTYWQSGEHELDFVLGSEEFLEVKLGRSGPLDFAWFSRVFPRARLRVVSETPFAAERMTGITMEEFLLEEE